MMQGSHYTADLIGCNLNKLTEYDALIAWVLTQVNAVGLRALTHQFYLFPNKSKQLVNGGITMTVLLAESHICIHTWPELLAVTLDVYVCNVETNNSNKAQQLIELIIQWFEPINSEQQVLKRGRLLPVIRA